MRTGIEIEVTGDDRARLEAIVADRNRRQKHVERARIVLLSANGVGTLSIMRQVGCAKATVWRWQARFMAAGVDGLLRDKSRPPGKAPLPEAVVERVIAFTLAEPPGEATHWTGRAMAEVAGISLRSVQRIWAGHGLQPHRVKRFKLSKDPEFAAKLRDIVGLYIDPPAHAVVLSVDEKSQIQALDRTQPGLPMKRGKAGTMTFDYKRHGITTMFAAFNVLDGTVLGRCMQRHRHQEFIRFLNAIERAVPAGKVIHVILDNYATHKHPKVLRWLGRHPRFVFHFTPTSCSWLNAVETFFSRLTRRRLKRGVFRSIVELQAAIHRYIAEHNAEPKPFVWTADPDVVLGKVTRGTQALASVH
jgi:transposase